MFNKIKNYVDVCTLFSHARFSSTQPVLNNVNHVSSSVDCDHCFTLFRLYILCISYVVCVCVCVHNDGYLKRANATSFHLNSDFFFCHSILPFDT